MFCDEACGALPCGGRHHNVSYYSLYCPDLQGVETSAAAGTANTADTEIQRVPRKQVLGQLVRLHSETLVVASLLAAIAVFLMVILALLFLKNQVPCDFLSFG